MVLVVLVAVVGVLVRTVHAVLVVVVVVMVVVVGRCDGRRARAGSREGRLAVERGLSRVLIRGQLMLLLTWRGRTDPAPIDGRRRRRLAAH